MRKYIQILFIVLLFQACKTSQYVDDSQKIAQQALMDKQNFPASWEGKYIGELQIFSNNQATPTQTVEMELIIEQVDVDSSKYEWKIIYGEDKIKGMREYQLITKDQKRGRFAIDERNSIVLDAHFFDGKLISRFSVSGNLLTATYRKEGNHIYFEILSGKEKVKEFTGGGEDVPNVGIYGTTIYQIAKLTKIF